MKRLSLEELTEKINLGVKVLLENMNFYPNFQLSKDDILKNPDKVKDWLGVEVKRLHYLAEPETYVATFLAMVKRLDPKAKLKVRVCFAVTKENEKLLEYMKDTPRYNYFEVRYGDKKFTFVPEDTEPSEYVLTEWKYLDNVTTDVKTKD
jgi:hypothetical protein